MALAVLLALLFSVATAGASPDLGASIKDAEQRAEQTLNGLFHYYWKQDPTHKKVKFFFACAQIGEVGTAKTGKCSCYDPNSCVNCYRWWSAVALESVAAYGVYMNTTNHSSVPDVFYKHSPYNAEWNAVTACTYIDDFLWYGIAYLKVYDWLGVSIYISSILSPIRVASGYIATTHSLVLDIPSLGEACNANVLPP